MDKHNDPRRATPRFNAELPVTLDGQLGVTRDISATGAYFEVNSSAVLGSTVTFDIYLKTPNGSPAVLKCQGQIVRTELQGQRRGIAVTFSESALHMLDQSGDEDGADSSQAMAKAV